MFNLSPVRERKVAGAYVMTAVTLAGLCTGHRNFRVLAV